MRNYASKIFLLIGSVLVLSSLSPSENPIYDRAILDSPNINNVSNNSSKNPKTTAFGDNNAVPLRRDIYVMGIIIDDENDILSGAIFSIDGEQKFVRIGDLVVDGILLDKVKDHYAYVSYSYNREKMRLDESKTDVIKQGVNPGGNKDFGGIFGSSDSALKAGVLEDTLNQSSPNIRALGDRFFEVSRNYITENIESRDTLDAAKFTPFPEGGFLISQIQPESMFSKLGFKKWDVIFSANGKPINSLGDMFWLRKQLQEDNSISLEIREYGSVESIFREYYIHDL